jgi:hypothetical protein
MTARKTQDSESERCENLASTRPGEEPEEWTWPGTGAGREQFSKRRESSSQSDEALNNEKFQVVTEIPVPSWKA